MAALKAFLIFLESLEKKRLNKITDLLAFKLIKT